MGNETIHVPFVFIVNPEVASFLTSTQMVLSQKAITRVSNETEHPGIKELKGSLENDQIDHHILQIRKMILREVKEVVQDHTIKF